MSSFFSPLINLARIISLLLITSKIFHIFCPVFWLFTEELKSDPVTSLWLQVKVSGWNNEDLLYSTGNCIQNIVITGLPWWRSGWESACQCRGHGFGPWSGGIPHAAERLGPWATVAEPARLEPVLRGRRGRDGERSAHRGEEWSPLATTGESPWTEAKTQHSHK